MKEVEKNQELNEDELKDVNGGLSQDFHNVKHQTFAPHDNENAQIKGGNLI